MSKELDPIAKPPPSSYPVFGMIFFFFWQGQEEKDECFPFLNLLCIGFRCIIPTCRQNPHPVLGSSSSVPAGSFVNGLPSPVPWEECTDGVVYWELISRSMGLLSHLVTRVTKLPLISRPQDQLRAGLNCSSVFNAKSNLGFFYGQRGCKTMLFKIKLLSSGQWQRQQQRRKKCFWK